MGMDFKYGTEFANVSSVILVIAGTFVLILGSRFFKVSTGMVLFTTISIPVDIVSAHLTEDLTALILAVGLALIGSFLAAFFYSRRVQESMRCLLGAIQGLLVWILVRALLLPACDPVVGYTSLAALVLLLGYIATVAPASPYFTSPCVGTLMIFEGLACLIDPKLRLLSFLDQDTSCEDCTFLVAVVLLPVVGMAVQLNLRRRSKTKQVVHWNHVLSDDDSDRDDRDGRDDHEGRDDRDDRSGDERASATAPDPPTEPLAT